MLTRGSLWREAYLEVKKCQSTGVLRNSFRSSSVENVHVVGEQQIWKVRTTFMKVGWRFDIEKVDAAVAKHIWKISFCLQIEGHRKSYLSAGT